MCGAEGRLNKALWPKPAQNSLNPTLTPSNAFRLVGLVLPGRREAEPQYRKCTECPNLLKQDHPQPPPTTSIFLTVM